MNRKLKNEELDRLSVSEFVRAEKAPIRVILEDIRSMSNVGSVFRTADAFLIDELILCGITGIPPHREIQKTALGATESVKWSYKESIVEAIYQSKKDGFTVLCAEQSIGSISLAKLPIFEKIAIVLGNEVNGVSQSAIDQSHGVVEIPQEGTKHSLNLAVATGIVLWEIRRNL